MKSNWCCKIISLLLVIATLITALPMTVFAEGIQPQEKEEVYIKSVKLAQGSKEKAKEELASEGYILLEQNLNEGTGQSGVWLGYQTTTDPTEAIYDMKLMNMKGGFTLTSMEEALATQETAFASMAVDLNYLIEEFVEAYEEESVPAQKAYKALNFFRVVDGETELAEENGLGYQIVNDGITLSMLTEIIMFCDPEIVDSVVKILTMGIQIRNENWMKQLSAKGPYDSDTAYMDDEEELNRRAEQLLIVLGIYADAYNAMDKSGIIPDDLDENFEPQYDGDKKNQHLTAEEADKKKLDESRYKFYKIVFDELEKYKYGDDGETLKDFFCSLAEEGNAKKLYPLVSVLTDGEFSALSYGCFLEMVTGATSTPDDFDSYDEVYATLTEETSSVYLYAGVDKALFEEDAIVGFTDTAQRHMASTGELEFFEKESSHERILEDGIRAAKCIAATGLAVMGIAKITLGTIMIVGVFSSAASTSIATGILAGVVKFCSVISGGYALLIVIAVVALVIAISYIVAVINESINGKINWDDNPMPQYLYDVKEVTFSQSSDGGVATEFMQRPVFALYEAVTDVNDNIVDLNARSKDASQWIELFVSYDRQGDNAKPIKAEDLLVKTGNGETPDGYVPLTRFGEVIAYDLNQWDEDNDVNGIYLFYKQDQDVVVDSGKTYYISEVYLQAGESDAHCIELLEAAGYTPINMNLSPDWDDGDFAFNDKVYTYIGYKVTTNPESAIRDIRVDYAASRGELRFGTATYAECGSNGALTLYATKYDEAGTPLLAGGLICIDSRDKAPEGYEPVNVFGGGPAVSLNVSREGIGFDTMETFLYFLPEMTFTSGTLYLGGVSYINIGLMGIKLDFYNEDRMDLVQKRLKEKNPNYNVSDKKKMISDYILQEIGFDPSKDYAVSSENNVDLRDNVVLHGTYNPYRAIYAIKATSIEDSPATFSFENIGYSEWGDIEFTANNPSYQEDYDFFLSYNAQSELESLDLYGKLYVCGNPTSDNLYDETKSMMMKPKPNSKGGVTVEGTQPIELANVKCFQNDVGIDIVKAVGSAFKPVTDVFGNSETPAVIEEYWVENKYKFYTITDIESRPYVSAITAIDELTLYRAYGGYDAGLSFKNITNDMMLAQLANQGATNFNSYRVSLRQTDFWDGGGWWDSYDELNAIKFGYARTATKKEALCDLFLYFNGFANDDPPKEMYRGSVKYTLICEIPYNLTGYDSAPKTGVYLYGTTDTKAGGRIIDFEVSGTPFMAGYETVRTLNGGSIFSEIKEYSDIHHSSHPMSWARKMFGIIYNYFNNDDKKQENGFFYLHIKREGDDLEKQKPYIEKLYVSYCDADKTSALDMLFDLGAEGYVDVDLNKGASGDYVYVGYSYTSDPAKAIKDIRVTHDESAKETLVDDNGRTFTLASDIDLNKGAGGDTIYLYTTTESETADPISKISVAFSVTTGEGTTQWVDGTTVKTNTYCTKRWNSNKNSDLNKWAGGKYIYLMYTTVDTTYKGTAKDPNYGKDKLYSRDDFENKKEDGKYIGGLYVMDKETIRLEKIKEGTLSASSTCKDVSDEEVFARLKKMGATTIIDTPILVDDGGYFDGNTNKVFIGYSRTDKSSDAIKNIAIKAEVLSVNQPKERIEINNKAYRLVAEAAEDVTELPKAINLIGISGYSDVTLPRMYLYCSTSSGSDPIYDICIDELPLLNGWNTVRSANLIDPFADISDQAHEQYELANQDDWDFYDSEIVYTDALFEWMDDVSNLFDPEDAKATPFYIHVKRHTAESIEQVKPYIGDIFVVKGGSKHEALSKLVAFEPDEFIEVNLNQEAGGNKVYMAYKRVAKARDALTDIMVYQGEKFEPTRRLTINGKNVKFTLVADVDLNSKAGGKYLYLYTTDSKYSGNPITDLDIQKQKESYLKCGVEKVVVKRADGKEFTDEDINLNKGAGGDTIYMIMTRETEEGHTSNNIVTEEIVTEATCVDDGSCIHITACVDCGIEIETVVELFEAHGVHVDSDTDGDHDCDNCDAIDVTEHTMVHSIEKDPENLDGYKVVLRCSDCEEESGEELSVENDYNWNDGAASLFSSGSGVAVLSFAGVAALAAIVVFIKRKKVTNINDGDNET